NRDRRDTFERRRKLDERNIERLVRTPTRPVVSRVRGPRRNLMSDHSCNGSGVELRRLPRTGVKAFDRPLDTMCRSKHDRRRDQPRRANPIPRRPPFLQTDPTRRTAVTAPPPLNALPTPPRRSPSITARTAARDHESHGEGRKDLTRAHGRTSS